MAPSISQISSLQATLNTALDAFKAELAAQNLPEPSLTTAIPHPLDDVSYLPTPTMYEAQRATLASMGLLKQLIQSPHDALATSTLATLEAASLRLAAELGLSDLLAAAPGPESGAPIAEIATQVDVDGAKLERILHLLVTQGWYREPSPGVFANNRRSNTIQRSSPGWYLASYWNELVHRMSEKLPLQLTHPDASFRFSDSQSKCAFNLAFNTDVPYFGAGGRLALDPEEGFKFGRGMGALGAVSDPGVAADYPWEELARGKDGVVDVGGGQGTLACALAEKYPGIQKFVVQDLEEAREMAESYIKGRGLQDRVVFEAQDFFAPQQRKGKYIFVLQRVLHDWSLEDAASILRQIRGVLNEDSVVLIVETLIPNGVMNADGPSLVESLVEVQNSKAYTPADPPPLFPADFGEASRMRHLINATLMVMCNSYERTLPQLKEMVELAGLKIKKVYPTRGWASITEVGMA